MNLKFLGEHRASLQIILSILVCIGLILLIYAIAFENSLGLGPETSRNAARTKTAIALTSQALLDPFPTSTVFTSTASLTPTMTLTPSTTPTPTPSRTPFRFLSETPTPRTKVPNSATPVIGAPTSINPEASTQTPAPPANTPVQNTSEPPAATDIPILTVIPPILQTLLP